MSRSQVSIRCSDSQYTAWSQAASSDERELVDWARRVLDLAADSGLSIVQLRDLLKTGGADKQKRK